MSEIRFTDGQLLRLLANDEEGWKEQLGLVEGGDVLVADTVVCVRLLKQYRSDPLDDGLREVAVEGVEEI